MSEMKPRKPPFWVRVRMAQARKVNKDEARVRYLAIWEIVARLADHKGRTHSVTASGAHINPRRHERREAELAGLATSGRQWRKLRKRMRREEKQRSPNTETPHPMSE